MHTGGDATFYLIWCDSELRAKIDCFFTNILLGLIIYIYIILFVHMGCFSHSRKRERDRK